MALRDGLRSGDVHVPGSRRHADPASFLLRQGRRAHHPAAARRGRSAEAEALRGQRARMLPRVPIAPVLVEILPATRIIPDHRQVRPARRRPLR
jgi:hypothetical protein